MPAVATEVDRAGKRLLGLGFVGDLGKEKVAVAVAVAGLEQQQPSTVSLISTWIEDKIKNININK